METTAKKRVLLVDDEPTITRTVKLYLEGTGAFEVRTENQGKQAIPAAREFRPQVIVLDIVMPDADGGTIAADIKADPDLKDTPILFLTALVSQSEVGAHRGKIGGHPFLAKPVDMDKLVDTLNALAGGH
ncbi:MAG: response regulator [Gemmatimonadetes bacterium]|nr:response regulator [Gemmatimonadota bacterium]